MASADSLLRLKVDSKEYDQKIERARSGLLHLEQSLQKAGKSFADADKDAVEYVRELGKMGTVTNTTRGKIGELSKAFIDLSSQYQRLSDKEKQSPIGKAMSQSLDQLRDRTIEAKKELADLESQIRDVNTAGSSGGGLFGDDAMKGMLQVFGGNLMTNAAEVIGKVGTEIANLVNQSVELVKQTEGITIAFDRLNQPGLLENLREATHGTVSDLKLMETAVKFNDFKLNLNEMGTLLAFAQQKAKDTGQSIDYMVDSITTGLGRQSLQILDNLGLSAAEVKEKMKETGDMTTAVGAIIRDQMEKAGEYVETAADRAARANADLENAMLELGEAMREVFGYTGWDEMASSIKADLVGALTDVINGCGVVKDAFSQIPPEITMLLGPIGSVVTMIEQMGTTAFNSFNLIRDGATLALGPVGTLVNMLKALGGKTFSQAVADAAVGNFTIYDPGDHPTTTPTTTTKTKKGSGGKTTPKPKPTPTHAVGSIAAQEAEVQRLTKAWKEATEAERENAKFAMNQAKWKLANMYMKDPRLQKDNKQALASMGGDLLAPDMKSFKLDKNIEVPEVLQELPKIGEDTSESWKEAASAIQGVGSALAGLEDPAVKVVGIVAEAIANVALAAGKAMSAKDTTASGWAWIGAAAAITATMISTIAAIHSATGFAEGGIVQGNTLSGDRIPAMLNAQEVVLTAAQAGNLASQLTGGGLNNLRLSVTISGEQIRLALNNNSRRRGRGEYVTSNSF